jgi:hypothetical protein
LFSLKVLLWTGVPKQIILYARHRPTEAYFWALGVYYEPQYAKARMLLAKFVATITPYDDTFDNYGMGRVATIC